MFRLIKNIYGRWKIKKKKNICSCITSVLSLKKMVKGILFSVLALFREVYISRGIGVDKDSQLLTCDQEVDIQRSRRLIGIS